MKYKKILCAHDGSSRSEKAYEHAKYLAKDLNSELVLLNVLSVPVKPFGISPTTEARKSIKEHLEKIEKTLKKDIEKMFVEKVNECKKLGIPTRYVIEYGVPIEKIPEFTAKEKVDVIVMASKPLPGMTRMSTLGSVSRCVAERVKCPVLIVH
jgi:nucleotide-binding universal stress UspA family protein